MNQKQPRMPELGPATGTSLAEASRRFRACAEADFLRHGIEKRYGGFGSRFAELVDAHEILGRQTRDPGLLLAINAHLWGSVFPLIKFGTEAQKNQWLPALLDGSSIGGHAITEPQAGSDVQGMETSAEVTGEGYILNGRKRYITNTPLADMLVVYAKLKQSDGITAFIVQPQDIGVEFSGSPTVQGCATAAMGDVVLSDCHLPADRLLGKKGAGGTMIQLALELERAFIFAGIVGVMDWQLQQVLQFARARPSGESNLSAVQAVSHKIADMKLRLDTCRLWIRQCADLVDSGKRLTVASAQAKLYASEAFLQSSLDAAHIQGAAGLEKEMPVLVQDAMAGRLLSGSSEIQKNIISAMLGLGGKTS